MKIKWINPLYESLLGLPDSVLKSLIDSVENLAKKYEVTLSEVKGNIVETEGILSTLIADLVANDYDMQGLKELNAMFKG